MHQRFQYRRQVTVLRSDNGTNFIGAEQTIDRSWTNVAMLQKPACCTSLWRGLEAPDSSSEKSTSFCRETTNARR